MPTRDFPLHVDRPIAPGGVSLPGWVVLFVAIYFCFFVLRLGAFGGPFPVIALFIALRKLTRPDDRGLVVQVAHYLVGRGGRDDLLPSARRVRSYGP